MISLVTFEKTHYNVLPYKFEAGTPHIAGGIGLAAAIDYLAALDWNQVTAHEHDLQSARKHGLRTAFVHRPFEHGPIGMDTGVVLEGQPDTPATAVANPVLNWEWITSGYFKDEGGNPLRDGWFPTGDVATIDADGFMQITDRSKDVVK